jgi:hypothetical protein
MTVRKSPLPIGWTVPKAFVDRLGDDVGRQRCMAADGHLLIILHQPPKADELQRLGRFFWRAPDGSWQSNNLGPGIRALNKHLDEYAEALQKLETAEEQAERADEFFPILESLAPLCRSTRNMYDTLQEARELFPDDHDLIVCRDRAYNLQRSADLIQTDTRNALDCAVVRRAEEEAHATRAMATSAYRLNVLAAMFFPLVTIAAIFGMSLPNGLEDAGPGLFWALLAAGVLCGLFLKAAIIDRPYFADNNRNHASTHKRLDGKPGRSASLKG